MMIYKCDRCGRIFERGERSKISTDEGVDSAYADYDLCGDCRRSFDDWLAFGRCKEGRA